MEKDAVIKLIHAAASAASLDPNLLQAIVSIESFYNPQAIKYEPNWIYLVSPEAWASKLLTTIVTETQLQMFSWGLCQMMGSMFRQYGYSGPLTGTLDPALNLSYGAKHLRMLMDKYKDDNEKAIAAYNAGAAIKMYNGQWKNGAYVNRVLNIFQNLSAAQSLVS